MGVRMREGVEVGRKEGEEEAVWVKGKGIRKRRYK